MLSVDELVEAVAAEVLDKPIVDGSSPIEDAEDVLVVLLLPLLTL